MCISGGIPNGIISRHPIAASGHWDDPVLDNREFAWARIRLLGDRDLLAVSVHLHSKNASSRVKQTSALLEAIHKNVPAGAMLLFGGDLNTRSTGEPCFALMAKSVVVPRSRRTTEWAKSTPTPRATGPTTGSWPPLPSTSSRCR